MELIDELAVRWQAAKQKEEQARDVRIGIEEQILALHPAKEEGTSTVKTPAGVKLKLTGRMAYKVDLDRLQMITAAWPSDVRPVKTEVKADDTKLRALRQEFPKLWADIAPAITLTPGKTGVAIEFKE